MRHGTHTAERLKLKQVRDLHVLANRWTISQRSPGPNMRWDPCISMLQFDVFLRIDTTLNSSCFEFSFGSHFAVFLSLDSSQMNGIAIQNMLVSQYSWAKSLGSPGAYSEMKRRLVSQRDSCFRLLPPRLNSNEETLPPPLISWESTAAFSPRFIAAATPYLRLV